MDVISASCADESCHSECLGQNQILYVDNLRMLLYWCFKRAPNGSCVQYDVDILVRTRHLAHHDLALLEPYLKMACVHHDRLRWFDLHCEFLIIVLSDWIIVIAGRG